jgi:hypothetical protein
MQTTGGLLPTQITRQAILVTARLAPATAVTVARLRIVALADHIINAPLVLFVKALSAVLDSTQ